MEEDALYQLACECEETLHQIQDTLAHPEALPSDRQLCTELQERFAIWAAYIGVFARKSQCLDRRLRKLPDLQVIAAQLLNILRQTLQRSLETFQKRHASSNDGSEPQDPEATDTGGLGAVDGILTRLNYLSINIRRCSRPVMDDRLYKVAEQHDVDSFASLCTSAVEILYPKAHQSLQTVLADSMKNRFVRILYGSSRNEKLRTRREEQDRRNRESKPSVPALVPRPATTQPLLSANAARPPPFPRDLAPSTSAASQSDLSRLDMRRFQAQRLLDMPAPSAPTTVSLQQRDISYPKKPDPDGSSNYTTCPWCSEEINSQMSDKEWQYVHDDPYTSHFNDELTRSRRHVRQDLKPYVCLWERCPSDERTFAKFSQWVYHMEQHNRQWYRKVFLVAAWICPLCQVPNEPWPNPEALLAHLNNVHPGVFPESSVEAVSRHSRTEQPRPWNQCLICSCIHEGETAGDSHAELDLRKRGKDQLSTDERAKRVRNASGDGKPGQSSASELSDLSDLDSDDESVFAQRKLQTQERSEIMAKHVATHLEMLMSLTLRFKELRNAENTLEYDAWSDRPEFSHSLDSKERAERDLLSDIDQPFEAVPGEDETGSQYGHSEFVKVQETEQAAKLDLDESFQMPVPDAEVDFTDVTRHFDTMSADDARHRAMIESGAFQVAIEEPESPTQSSDRDSLFEKLDAPQGLMTLYEDPERVDFE